MPRANCCEPTKVGALVHPAGSCPEQLLKRKMSQRDLERAGVASQSTISGLVTGRAWTDMWVVARVVAHLGGELGVQARPADR